MKTFTLISLEIVNDSKQTFETENVPLLDGLIINREDEKSQWLIEAYVNKDQGIYFNNLQEKREQLMLCAKISKPENKPALFLCDIVSVNRLENNMNILFLGKLVDEKKEKVENILKSLIDKGYQGEELLQTFIKQV